MTAYSNARFRFPAALILLLGSSRRARHRRHRARGGRNDAWPAFPWKRASARLDLLSDKQTRLTVARAPRRCPTRWASSPTLRWYATSPVIAEPRFGCDAGRFTGTRRPHGFCRRGDDRRDAHRHRGHLVRRTRTANWRARTAKFDGRIDEKGWQVKGTTGTTTVDGAAQVRRALVRTAGGHHRRRQSQRSKAAPPTRARAPWWMPR